MAVYNGAEFVDAAVRSILAQSYTDFEFVIVDDGSTDRTREIIGSFQDERIRLVNAQHEGLTAALNRGVLVSRGVLIARMDADDVALSDRFAIQVAYLEANPKIGVVCSDVSIIDGNGIVLSCHSMGRWDTDTLRASLLFRKAAKPIIHPSVMMRREVWDSLGGYRKFDYAEDFDLWLRACDRFEFAHIPEPLLLYRIHPGGVTVTKQAVQALSRFMSVICYRVDSEMGVDLFAEHKDLFDRTAAEVREQMEVDILAAVEYRKTRLLMRSKGTVKSLGAITKLVWRHWPRLVGSVQRRRLVRLTTMYAQRVCSELTSESNAVR